MATTTIEAEPEPIAIDLSKTAIAIIDMQRDFLLAGGFGETLGNDVSLPLAAVELRRRLLSAGREKGVFVIHTREGHRPDLRDAPKAKVERGVPSIGCVSHSEKAVRALV
jgi:nicotinamidase-related amidase